MILKGKNAIVTGSTSGIGEAIARKFATEGANVMLNGFADAKTVDAIKADIAKAGVKVEYSPADMSKPAEVKGMVEAAAKAFGGVDIIVNNAGIQFTAPIEQFPEDKWDAIIAINLSAAFHGTKAAIPLMKKAGWGRIINIASVHGLVASKNKVAYVAAKHGIIGLTQTTALEIAENNITCNAICPGWVLTPLVEKQIRDKAQKEGKSEVDAKNAILEEKTPTMKFVKPEDIGALITFLCGPSSESITGSSLVIDGGWTAE
jgi:3-hydroxybutyrate dehydrogenase